MVSWEHNQSIQVQTNKINLWNILNANSLFFFYAMCDISKAEGLENDTQRYCNETGTLIPTQQICDKFQDCPDDSDEINCGNRPTSVASICYWNMVCDKVVKI